MINHPKKKIFDEKTSKKKKLLENRSRENIVGPSFDITNSRVARYFDCASSSVGGKKVIVEWRKEI